MKFDSIQFQWDAFNEPKLWERHQVTADEAEEVFHNPNVVRRSSKPLEEGATARYYIFGRTDAGRPLFLVFLYVHQDSINPAIRIFSGRTMTRPEIQWFEKQR